MKHPSTHESICGPNVTGVTLLQKGSSAKQLQCHHRHVQWGGSTTHIPSMGIIGTGSM